MNGYPTAPLDVNPSPPFSLQVRKWGERGLKWAIAKVDVDARSCVKVHRERDQLGRG